MSNLSPERRKIAALGGGAAAMCASTTTLRKGHPAVSGVMLAVAITGLVYAMKLLADLKKQG